MAKHLKNLACFVLLIILSCIALACAPNKNDQYRQSQKKEIQSYVSAKLQDDYSEENRNTINEVISSCNKSIDDAKTAQEIDSVIIKTKQELDGIEPVKSGELKDGVYLITDTSYEWYKVKHILRYDPEVANQHIWVLIFDGQITINDRNPTVYTITENNDIYRGTSFISNIDIWVSNDILYVRDKKETIQYELDSSYDVSHISETKQLSAPTDIRIYEATDNVTFMWEYDYSYGFFGCASEIKNSEYTEYTPIKVDYPYMNTLVVQVFTPGKYSGKLLMQGENLVRLHHIGGYRITNTKKVYASLKSEYVTFRVMVDGETITAEQI